MNNKQTKSNTISKAIMLSGILVFILQINLYAAVQYVNIQDEFFKVEWRTVETDPDAQILKNYDITITHQFKYPKQIHEYDPALFPKMPTVTIPIIYQKGGHHTNLFSSSLGLFSPGDIWVATWQKQFIGGKNIFFIHGSTIGYDDDLIELTVQQDVLCPETKYRVECDISKATANL